MTATKTKERPILFSAPMVRAILAGRKTQTRRIAKLNELLFRDASHYPGVSVGAVESLIATATEAALKICPYGQVGDRLWVRESFADAGVSSPTRIRYRATDAERAISWRGKWKPSIHMPRGASRIALEITGIRVQRLQEISHDDILAEGVQYPVHPDDGSPLLRLTGDCPPSNYLRPIDLLKGEAYTHQELLRAHFSSLWESINGKDSWYANPLIWAVTFKVTYPIAKAKTP